MEQFPAKTPNPLLSVTKDGIVNYSNDAAVPLLHEWGVRIGGNLPSNITDLVQRVIFQHSPEKREVKVGDKVYLAVFSPLPEKECISISGFDISNQKGIEEKAQESEAKKVSKIEFAEIIDAQAIQSLMDDFYKLTHIPIGIIDIKGNVLVGVGWQDICTKFHRVHPEACKHCFESDTKLSLGVSQGEFKLYKCKNNMWDAATPIMISGQHVANIFLGQFFFDDETLDYELFRAQARKYSFNEEEYIAALEKVPRLSREALKQNMSFFMKLSNMLSQLSHSNFKFAKSLTEYRKVDEALKMSETELERAQKISQIGSWTWDLITNEVTWSEQSYRNYGLTPSEVKPSYEFFLSFIVPEDRERVDREVQKSIESGNKYNITYKIIRKDGILRILLSENEVIRDETGKIIKMYGTNQDITERKLLEEQIRQRAEEIETVMEVAPVAIFISHDTKCQKITGNLMANELYEAKLGENVSANISNLRRIFCKGIELNADKLPMQKATYEDIDVLNEELDLLLPSGERRAVIGSASPLHDSNGNVRGSVGTFMDITERKKVEAELEETLENLENLVKERTSELEEAYNLLKVSETGLAEAQRMAHIGNWVWDIATGKEYWSDELYRIFKRDPHKVSPSYKEYLSYVHPDDREYVDNAFKGTIDGKPYEIDHRIILANGEERTVRIHAEVVFDEKNIPIQTKGIVQDITERRKAQEKIQYLANIVESSKDAIVTVSLDGIVTSWNEGAEQIFGYTDEEILGKKVSILEPDDFRGEIKQFIEEVKQGRKIKLYESSRLKKDGTIIIISGTLSPVLDTSGKLVAISAIERDITDRKRAEEAIAEIEIARKKEIHHRIKNNLQVISSLLDLQAEQFKNKECIHNSEVLEAFRESKDRVISMALIHEELYKGDGFDTLNFSPYIQELAENLLQIYKLGDTEITLSLDLEDNLFFDMDIAVPLGMIINELVSNSLKYAFIGRDKGEIRIRLVREESLRLKNQDCKSTIFTMTISDNGVGIAENINIEKLDSLGLQLITSLVDQLDGELELKRNNGTEFIVRFKIKER